MNVSDQRIVDAMDDNVTMFFYCMLATFAGSKT